MTTQIDFENLLREAIGLDSASIGSATIAGAVRKRMIALELTETEQYWDRLKQLDDERQELIESVVVPETWFFRDPEAFEVLARLTMQEWLPTHPQTTLRLFSAACCTGEEPYSMAMTLLDAGLPEEQFEIDAVDISARALDRARHGVYGSNSFRGEQLLFRERYFEKTQREYCLSKELRKVVNFQQANCLSLEVGAGLSSYDVIFCRNVLIYFDHDAQQRALKILAALLAPDGLLFVGPAEAFLAASNGFTSVNQSMSFAFRKGHRPSEDFVTKGFSVPAKQINHSQKRRISAGSLAAAPSPIRNDSFPDYLGEAKRLADSGRLAEAAELCEMYLKQNAPSSKAYYLLGLVRDSMGNFEMAAQCYRKVLYLDPNHHETMVHLALLSERQGDDVFARQLYERARRSEISNEK